MKTLRRKSKWRSKNQRRRLQRDPASIAWSAETRRLNRIARAEAQARQMADEVAETALAAPVISRLTAKPLRIRLSIEVTEPNGTRTRHTLTSTHCATFNAWSVPASRIVDGVRGLFANAPKIVAKCA